MSTLTHREKIIVKIARSLAFFLRACVSFMACFFRFASPSIKSFTHDTYVAIEGSWLTFHWKVKNSWLINISGAGTFINETSCRIPVKAGVSTYTLTAYGIFSNSTQTIRLNPVSIEKSMRFQASFIPLPEIPYHVKPIVPAPLGIELTWSHLSVCLGEPPIPKMPE